MTVKFTWEIIFGGRESQLINNTVITIGVDTCFTQFTAFDAVVTMLCSVLLRLSSIQSRYSFH